MNITIRPIQNGYIIIVESDRPKEEIFCEDAMDVGNTVKTILREQCEGKDY